MTPQAALGRPFSQFLGLYQGPLNRNRALAAIDPRLADEFQAEALEYDFGDCGFRQITLSTFPTLSALTQSMRGARSLRSYFIRILIMRVTFLATTIACFASFSPAFAGLPSSALTFGSQSEIAHGGGCRKSSPAGQCCHAGSQPYHCH